MTPYELNQVVKTQHIRLLDVFVIGPLMIYASTLMSKEHKIANGALLFFGMTTIGYNWRNYHRVKRA